MHYRLSSEVEGDLLRVDLRGDRPAKEALTQASREAWCEISRLASELACQKLLVVSHARGDYPTSNAYEINSTLEECGVQRDWAIAFVNFDAATYEDIKFAETVVVNRRFNIRVFNNVDAARSWLESIS